MRPEEGCRETSGDDRVFRRAKRTVEDEEGLYEATADPAFFLYARETETEIERSGWDVPHRKEKT